MRKDNFFVSTIKGSAFSEVRNLHWIPACSRLRTSAQEALLINKNLANSFLVSLSKPSAIFEEIEVVARNNWSRYQKTVKSANSFTTLPSKFIAFCQTIRSSKFSTFMLNLRLSSEKDSQIIRSKIPFYYNIFIRNCHYVIDSPCTPYTPGTPGNPVIPGTLHPSDLSCTLGAISTPGNLGSFSPLGTPGTPGTPGTLKNRPY